MPSTAPQPYLVESPAKAEPGNARAGTAFDPLLVLRAAVANEDQSATAERIAIPRRVIRRRGSIAQGRALETLGHAVEYLIDSRMFQLHEGSREPESEAVQILMRLSRQVFNECPEVVSLRTRVARLLSRPRR